CNNAEPYTSSADNCKGIFGYGDLNDPCPHYLPGKGHTLSDNIMKPIGQVKFSNVLASWTGHTSEAWTNEGLVYGRSSAHGNIVLLMDTSNAIYSGGTRTQSSVGTLMHELNHNLGVGIDHYHAEKVLGDWESCVNRPQCSSCMETGYRHPLCVMNNSHQSISHPYIICEPCKADIRTYLAKYA
ncbi:MAG: hypothetical protein FWD16_06190, partial [Clostridia bacterium]|nr:hypothetical protein [Clostridia bacterium]